jgi:hypothetical protein
MTAAAVTAYPQAPPGLCPVSVKYQGVIPSVAFLNDLTGLCLATPCPSPASRLNWFMLAAHPDAEARHSLPVLLSTWRLPQVSC